MDDRFADQFRDEEALGLVGELIDREQGGSLAQFVDHGFEQHFDALAVACGDRDHRLELDAIAEPRHERKELRFRDFVDLVEGEDDGLARLPQKVGDGTIVRAIPLGAVDHPDHRVGLADRRMRDAHHPCVHRVKRFDEARRVDEGDLSVRAIDVAEDAVARGLRLVGGDRDLLAHEAIQKR